tara:strand:- start:242 stop:364 length:123 start_codon:yes stop_codon:yes gene_type:complete
MIVVCRFLHNNKTTTTNFENTVAKNDKKKTEQDCNGQYGR